jgi:hypothetical protein
MEATAQREERPDPDWTRLMKLGEHVRPTWAYRAVRAVLGLRNEMPPGKSDLTEREVIFVGGLLHAIEALGAAGRWDELGDLVMALEAWLDLPAHED